MSKKKKLDDACIQINKRFCFHCFNFRQQKKDFDGCHKCRNSFVLAGGVPTVHDAGEESRLNSFANQFYESKLKDLYFGPVPSFLHIPKKVRDCVALLITECLEATVPKNSVTAWMELLCISKILFCNPVVGFVSDSTRRSAEITNLVRSRVKKWSDGLKLELICEALRCRKTFSHLNPDSNRFEDAAIRRAKRFANEGDLSKAALELANDSQPVFSSSIFSDLQRLHPVPNQPVTISTGGDLESHPATIFSVEEVISAINSFPKGTSGGPGGFRPSFMKELLLGVSSRRLWNPY